VTAAAVRSRQRNGRPPKPSLTDAEFDVAKAILERSGRHTGFGSAAQAISDARTAPHRVSASWLRRQLEARGFATRALPRSKAPPTPRQRERNAPRTP
jgi:hypothetical protein